MGDGVLQIVGLTKRYGDAAAIDGITLNIPPDCYVSLLGASGSGKTTFLRIIAGFEEPDAGSILFSGRPIVDTPAFRRGIGFVFQNFALFPHLSVYENIAFGLKNRAEGKALGKHEVRDRSRAILELVGLSGLEARGVHQISGGQRQRVALARTLVTEPRLVLLDEPLGALDANLRVRMRGELRRIRDRLGVTFLHVTGSEGEALAIGDRVVVLDRGRVAQFDTPDIVFNRPSSPSVAKSLNCYNLFLGEIIDGCFINKHYRFQLSSPAHNGINVSYAVRQDLITIHHTDAALCPGEECLVAKYVSTDYTGSAFIYFFQTQGGSIVEVENHLSHRSIRDLTIGTDYMLKWKADHALVFG